LKIRYDPKFRAKFADDYSEQAKYNNYEYEREVVEALSDVLDKDFEVLEIGAGPGTLTIPLAEKVKNCSHFLWQVKDIEKHLMKMENSSNYCAVIQPAGRDSMVKEMWTKITGRSYKGEFDPDADYFAYLILREWGRLVNVKL